MCICSEHDFRQIDYRLPIPYPILATRLRALMPINEICYGVKDVNGNCGVRCCILYIICGITILSLWISRSAVEMCFCPCNIVVYCLFPTSVVWTSEIHIGPHPASRLSLKKICSSPWNFAFILLRNDFQQSSYFWHNLHIHVHNNTSKLMKRIAENENLKILLQINVNLHLSSTHFH